MKIEERINWVDTAKGIGLLFVIMGHLHIPLVVTWVYTFHMPLFFFLSGVVFSGDKYTFKEFFKKKLKSLIIPYFSLGIVIYLFYVIINIIWEPENELYGSNWSMLLQFLCQEHFWTIWFLTCLFLAEILYYFVNILFKGKQVFQTIGSLGICLLGFLYYRLGGDGLPWNFDVALIAQFFFHLGYIFRSNKNVYNKLLTENKRKNFAMAIVFLIVNVLAGILCIKISGQSLDMSVGLYGNELLTMVSAVAGILFVVVISNNVTNKALKYLGENTMIIFAWHSRIIIVLCDYVYKWLGVFQEKNIVQQLLQDITTFVIIFVILVPINELIKKSKVHAWFGV